MNDSHSSNVIKYVLIMKRCYDCTNNNVDNFIIIIRNVYNVSCFKTFYSQF